MKSIIDNIFSPRFVLVLFSATTCTALFMGKISAEQFLPALMLVLGYFYGSKNAEKAAAAREAGVDDLLEV